jgi:hypothetical protein
MRRDDPPGDNKTRGANSTRNRSKQVELDPTAEQGDEWLTAIAALTEGERAPHDEPENYADIHYPGGAS